MIDIKAEAERIVVPYLSVQPDRTGAYIVEGIISLVTRVVDEQRESDAVLCESLVGDGSKPTDRLIGYGECAEAIRSSK